MSLDKLRNVWQYHKIPKEVVLCQRCVMSNQRPRISFDEQGVCSACNYAYKKDHLIPWPERERQLQDLLDRHRRTDGRYDVVVAVGGGKDSSTVAHKLKHQYNMHPLTATWAPQMFTDVGWRNLQSFIHSGFDNILGTPNGRVMQTMTRLCFENFGHPYQPFVYGQFAFPFRVAVNHKIPLVFYGENGEVEYGGASDYEDKPGQPVEDFGRLYYSGFPVEQFAEYGISRADLEPYTLPSYDELKDAAVEMHWFGYYHKWVQMENYQYAAEHCGFQEHPEGRSEGTYSKYYSLEDRLMGFHFYLAFIKFGWGRATGDASQEIRSGHINREEAIELVRKYDGEFPQKWFPDFLDYTQLSEERFWEVVDGFRSPHLWRKVSGEWELRHHVS